jgi:transglutaminase-like putative cysteine protease
MRINSLTVFLGLILMLCACQPISPQNIDPSNQIEAANIPNEVTNLDGYAAVSVLDSVEYLVVETFQISNHGPGSPSKHNLWVALIQDFPPYQQVIEKSITGSDYRTFEDEDGNLIAEFDLKDLQPGKSMLIEIRYRVKVNHLAYDLAKCEGELPKAFTSPELYIESDNPQIRSLAAELADEKTDTCMQVRSFYDFVAEHLVYTFNGKDWGAQATLGEMGADCSEYADLMIALSRAAGIPARYLEGVLFLEPDTQALVRTEHAWLEVFLPNIGWTPMDPTLGRALLFRDKYFAANNPDHIIVTRGRNPSALRGGSYYSHIYWPGPSAEIKIEHFGWQISPE